MGRRASREAAMKLLYQLEIQKSDRSEQIETALHDENLTDSDRKYIRGIIDGVSERVALLDRVIEKYAMGWKINRLSKVDLSILRIGIYEILYREDIPFSVSVNEAVELAKKYSNEDAGAFVNGLLAKVTKNDAEEEAPETSGPADKAATSEAADTSDK
ncbi:transcription antitermination factor NusB [Ruminiclostridium cellobioparum]|jgi:transcription antitermination protein NusB|uniref:Transcription antitermination protein NusB n=1 Tax=Ruminiclostridium cellobioparum subsp. termitidis CT1112 TaxID=1195236 RepID=S0FJK1_RUMCE|nr:transcription antitermination factor NusB [Ruminiclostridium cellobioparum]EMS71932.1 transcription antitermination factor NusB [Ruminiclostridium cellobioparum subsp. termitidis CT1112]